MNERIRELAEQALFESDFDDEQNIKITMDIFAEMIVRECAGIIESQDVDPSFKIRMSWAVKKHFGVEE